MKHFCDRIKGMGAAVCVGGWICAIYLPKRGVILMHGYRNVTPNPNLTIFFVPRPFLGYSVSITAKKRGGLKFAPK